MKMRDQSLDILRGMGIFFMVFDHIGWGTVVHTYIQSFHMPLFFIVSGYLWKNEKLSSLVQKRFKTLLIPYVFFAAIYLAIQTILTLGHENSFLDSLRAVVLYPSDMSNMPIAPALWFLPCMFLTSIVYSLLSRVSFKLKTLIIVGISSLGMLYSSLVDTMLPFTIEPMTVALGFMLVGELIKKKQELVMRWLDKLWLVLIVLIVEAILAMVNKSVDLRSARYHNCILYFLNGTFGTIAYWGIAKKIMPRKTLLGGVRWLSCLSQSAMGYICMNQFFIAVFGMILGIFMPAGIVFLLARKAAIFIAVMVTIYWTTRVIMGSRFKMILGGK